jgi:CheY-like chemotaxis protein/signal transduction histidine kinase
MSKEIFPEQDHVIGLEEYLELHQSSKTLFTFYSWHLVLVFFAMTLKLFGIFGEDNDQGGMSLFSYLRLVSILPITFHCYHIYQQKYYPTTWTPQPFRISTIENAYLISLTLASSIALIGASSSTNCTLALCQPVVHGQLQPALFIQNLIFGIISPLLVKAHHLWCVWLTFLVSFISSFISACLVGSPPEGYFSICAIYFLGAIVLYDNEITLRQCYHHHITQEEFLVMKLQTRHEKELSLLKHNQLRTLFGNVAHDFKSPLQGFTTELELLEKTFLSLTSTSSSTSSSSSSSSATSADQQSIKQSIKILQSVCCYMLMMINRAIDYSKVSSGLTLIPCFEKIHLIAVTSWVLRCVGSDQFQNASIRIEALSPEMCLNLVTDQQWLKENLLCLVSNALKFTCDGQVTIRYFLEAATSDGSSSAFPISSSETKSPFPSPSSHLYHGNTQKSPSEKFRSSITATLSSDHKYRHPTSMTKTADNVSTTLRGGSTSSQQFLRFEVEDSGVGVEIGHELEIFQPFTQHSGGTGLGLFSLRQRVECLGGKCGIGNRADRHQGSCFWFTIPYSPDQVSPRTAASSRRVAAAHEQLMIPEDMETMSMMEIILPPHTLVTTPVVAGPPSSSSLSSSPRGRGIHILLVEDSILIQKTSKRALTKEGYFVDIARHGGECLEMVALKRYDYILMDINMPVMDGLEATKRLRERERLMKESMDPPLPPPLCIIGISANGYADTVKEVLALGMDEFISKPLSLVQLTECFERIKMKTRVTLTRGFSDP